MDIILSPGSTLLNALISMFKINIKGHSRNKILPKKLFKQISMFTEFEDFAMIAWEFAIKIGFSQFGRLV